MPFKLLVLIPSFFLLVFLWSQPASAHLMIPPYPYDFERDGLFVTAPALLGAGVLAIPGAVVGGVVCLPVSVGEGFVDQVRECMEVGAIAAGVLGAAIIGAPFFLLKLMVWDLPRALLGIKKQELPPL